jgi:hypothetical protein
MVAPISNCIQQPDPAGDPSRDKRARRVLRRDRRPRLYSGAKLGSRDRSAPSKSIIVRNGVRKKVRKSVQADV